MVNVLQLGLVKNPINSIIIDLYLLSILIAFEEEDIRAWSFGILTGLLRCNVLKWNMRKRDGKDSDLARLPVILLKFFLCSLHKYCHLQTEK